MKILDVRNVHAALPAALKLLDEHGVERDSRNGPVRMAPWPVATVYQRPMERVLFWPERDANPWFHLYEALWMLRGRNDVAPLVRYAKQITEYSDDGVSLWGAYGHRWRNAVIGDQLAIIARRLRANPEDRRCVLEMWRAERDLDRPGRDVPCNVTATFQRNYDGALDLTVFNRSNDIIWGAYGANAVHFSLLLEYMALWIGCPIGVYRQISVNWHAYLEPLIRLAKLPRPPQSPLHNPYAMTGQAVWVPMLKGVTGDVAIHRLDGLLDRVLQAADAGFTRMYKPSEEEFVDMVYCVLYAHHLFKTLPAPQRYAEPLAVLQQIKTNVDWKVAATEWLERRRVQYENSQ